MPTPAGNASPYLTAAQLLKLVDWRLVADAVAEGNPRPSRAAVLDPTDPAGINCLELLAAASGDVESNCLRGSIYTAADLAALTGNSAADLRALVAGCVVVRLAGRRQPGMDKLSALAEWTQKKLESLRLGEKVFALAEQMDAGSGMDVTPFVPENPGDTSRTVNVAARYFGNRNRTGY